VRLWLQLKNLGGGNKYHNLLWSGAHNTHWQAVALAIEDADSYMRKLGYPLGFRLDLLRASSMGADIMQGADLPNADVLRSLRLDIKEIRKGLEYFWSRDQHNLVTEQYRGNFRPSAANRCIKNDWIVDTQRETPLSRQ
jgi:hypothetical protein